MKTNYKKPDFWALKAQKEGYPARSVYKLQELDAKFSLFQKKSRMLDLGAAPGSWSLYVRRKFPKDTFLCACDLNELSREYDGGLFDDGESFFFLRGDFTLDENRKIIEDYGPYGLIISDAAPSTSGNSSLDSLRSLELAENVLSYCEKTLIQGGNMALKVFQGGQTAELLKKMRSMFKEAKSFKPKACRASSFEVYFVGLGKIS
jgi:23S rRNA (uridine2552-2'-O)-methyltransferase